MSERAPLIRADRVTKRYGSFTAVDTVSLDVFPGEIVGLLGANGAGKTTLIKNLLGLTVPTEGAVIAFGRLPDRATRGRLGYVPQGLGLWPTLTVAENISFASAAFQAETPTLEPALAAVQDRLVGEIGLGLQRQLAFTIALAHHPELLVLDEPTSGVEPLARARLWDTVHDQADQGVGVLVTTHYMQEAQQCDRLVLMSHGKAVAAGSERDIIGNTTACEVDTPHWAAAFAALDEAGLPVTLNGRRVRLADTPSDTITRVLHGAHITADVREVPATLEEKMTVIDRAATPA
ncbi:ABC transporter ATP-binding protein [Streptomyces longispororuber]|uniref:ABC transporter ATP-binding protein n=1 Tax=Streptomyces longispororuber TaxID=68230 RepID=UPI00210B3125|nr:ATP-binding cassette domain-containing protein [Streptomyces longispororuber]MCQ4212481.1 ATP-binding cassette domain-containing protein [Streptomyces longispororuber]